MNDDAIMSKIKLMQDNSILSKLKRSFGIVKITDQEIRYMKHVLKIEYKPIFSKQYIQQNQSKDMHDLSIRYFDENIERLPNNMIMQYYVDYQTTKIIPNDMSSFKLFSEVMLSYSYQGWFREKMSHLH